MRVIPLSPGGEAACGDHPLDPHSISAISKDNFSITFRGAIVFF